MISSRRFLTTLSFIVILCLFGMIGAPQIVAAMNPAMALGAVITVNTTADEYNADGDCSLREAILAANRNMAVDACTAGTTIQDTVMIPAGVYLISIPGVEENNGETGDFDITGATILQGAGTGTTTINAQGADRVLDILAAASVNVQVRNLTVRGGDTMSQAITGGGIHSTADLDLVNVQVLNNLGGGVLSTGSLTVLSSTLSANFVLPRQPGMPGGAGLDSTGSVLVENSLISGNTAFHYDSSSAYGGGWMHRGGSATMLNSTVTGNGFEENLEPIPDAGFGYGANIYSLGTITISDSTIADGVSEGQTLNTPASLEGNISLRNSIVSQASGMDACAGNVQSLGYNISNQSNCTDFTEEGDILGSNTILLGALQDNGGATFTRALGAGSAAIDSGSVLHCPTIDQRGTLRPQDGDGDGSGACDRGAYEAGEGDPEPTATTTASPSPTATNTPVATNTVLPTSTMVPSATPSATVTPTDTMHTLFMPLIMEMAHAGLPDEDLLLYSVMAEDLEGVDFALGTIPPDSERFPLTTDGNNSQLNEIFLNTNGLQRIFAPDGNHLTFTKLEEGGAYLWVMAADGSNARRLTDEEVSWAEWAPDSKTIVYWVTRTGGPAALRTINIETGDVVTVANDAISRGVWHPSQPSLYYVADNPMRIVRVDADDNDTITIYTLPTGMTSIELIATIPGRILFHMADATGSDVYSVSGTGTNLTRITNDTELESNLHVSPDGSQLFYTHRGVDKIYLADTTGTSQWEYTFTCDVCSPDLYFAWAPDGSELTFSWIDGTLSNGDYGLYRLETDGSASAPTLIDQGDNRYRGVAYSPDSRYLAYSGADNEPYSIMLLDRTTNSTITWLESETYHFVWTWRPRP